MKSGLAIILFGVLLKLGLHAQVQENTNQQASTQEPDAYGIFDAFQGNPGKAALYSLILPGAGQFYNRKYWKVPLALAAEGAAIYILSQNIKEYNKWDTEWKSQLETGENNPEVTSVYDPTAIKRIRDNARQRKDYSWLGLIGVHILVSAEAFINRHLIEFDVSDDLSMRLSPAVPLAGLTLTMNF